MQEYLRNVNYQGNNIYCLDCLLQATETMFGLIEDMFKDHKVYIFLVSITSRVGPAMSVCLSVQMNADISETTRAR